MAFRRGARAYAEQFRHARPSPPRTRSCSTGWPRGSSTTAGRSRSSIGASCCRPPTGGRASRPATQSPGIPRTAGSGGSLRASAGRRGGPRRDALRERPARPDAGGTGRRRHRHAPALALRPDGPLGPEQLRDALRRGQPRRVHRETDVRRPSRPRPLFLSTIPSSSRRPGSLAERLAAEVPGDDAARIDRAYQLLFGRSARAEELEVCRAFLSRAGTAPGRGRLAGPGPSLAVQQRVYLRRLSRPAREEHSRCGTRTNPSRRDFLARAGNGFGLRRRWRTCWRASRRETRCAGPDRPANPTPSGPRTIAPLAKRCIFLYMPGGPSHIDLFDPKPRGGRDERPAAAVRQAAARAHQDRQPAGLAVEVPEARRVRDRGQRAAAAAGDARRRPLRDPLDGRRQHQPHRRRPSR